MNWNTARTRSLVYYGSVAALLCSATFLGYTKWQVYARTEKPPYSVGDRLPRVTFRLLDRSASSRTFDEIVNNGCMAFMFFDPHCPGCLNSAPNWAGRDSVSVRGVNVQMAWVGISGTDSAALRYLNCESSKLCR